MLEVLGTTAQETSDGSHMTGPRDNRTGRNLTPKKGVLQGGQVGAPLHPAKGPVSPDDWWSMRAVLG